MITFSQKQKDFINRPFKDGTLEVAEGSPRSGKTTALVYRYALFLMTVKDVNHLILAYSQEQAYRLVIEADGMGLLHIFQNKCSLCDSVDGRYLKIFTPGGFKRIYFKGGGNKTDFKRFQGMSFGSVVFCEIDLIAMPVIQEALRRTMASKLRVHFADLNPPSPMHPVIKEVFEIQPIIWTHFTIQDNPIIPEYRKKDIEETLKKSSYLYKRDWLGERVIPQGVIYSMWDFQENEADELPDDEQIYEMFFTGDGGLKDATAIECWLITRSEKTRKYTMWNYAEFYYSGREEGLTKALSRQAREIDVFIQFCIQGTGQRPSAIKIDPACLALREELEAIRYGTEAADNNGRDIKGSRKGLQVGIDRMQSLISERSVKILRQKNDRYSQINSRRELGLYVFDDSGNPVDMYNHAMDAWRYGCNYFYKNYKM